MWNFFACWSLFGAFSAWVLSQLLANYSCVLYVLCEPHKPFFLIWQDAVLISAILAFHPIVKKSSEALSTDANF